MSVSAPLPVLFIPHGGGPLPLLNDPGHQSLSHWFSQLASDLPKPKAILVISAHWEQPCATLTGAQHPPLIYDYYGFPPESYHITYPAAGHPTLASEIQTDLQQAGIRAVCDAQRGFDHGLFVPLKLIYPKAEVPCLQLSLLTSLDPAEHIALGRALAPWRKRGLLIIGSGMSFHNLPAMMMPPYRDSVTESEQFDEWINDTCCNPDYSEAQREAALTAWSKAPFARFCHPRAEHLLPLHVCFGAATGDGKAAQQVYGDELMGKRISGYRWS